MNRIITISREFGSGGRELGKRIAQTLNIAYYDNEIITKIAQRSGLAAEYVNSVIEKKRIAYYPITIGQTLSAPYPIHFDPSVKVYAEQRNIIEEMAARSDCVIIGRCSDYILEDRSPFKIFVYADMESKMRRCRERESQDENFSDGELVKRIKAIDKERAGYYNFFTGEKWGQKERYTLCINTSELEPSKIVSPLCELILTSHRPKKKS